MITTDAFIGEGVPAWLLITLVISFMVFVFCMLIDDGYDDGVSYIGVLAGLILVCSFIGMIITGMSATDERKSVLAEDLKEAGYSNVQILDDMKFIGSKNGKYVECSLFEVTETTYEVACVGGD